MKITKSQLIELSSALEGDGFEQNYYWDRKNGEVLLYCDPGVVGVSMEEMGFEEEPDENPERYLLIEPLDSHDGFETMERFVENLPEGECQHSLIRALRGSKPFASFKNVLYDFENERKVWFAHHDDWVSGKVHEFIQDNELGEIEVDSEK